MHSIAMRQEINALRQEVVPCLNNSMLLLRLSTLVDKRRPLYADVSGNNRTFRSKRNVFVAVQEQRRMTTDAL